MPHPIDTGQRTLIDPEVPSNGVTAQDIGPTGLAKNKVFAAGLFFRNTGAVAHTVTILSKGTGAAKILGVFDLAATPCTAIIDGRAGRYETDVGEKMQFSIDGGGTATDVKCSGSVVQHP